MAFTFLEFSALALLCSAFISPNTGNAQSNLVFNGSFEQTTAGWSYTGGIGIHPSSAAADGGISVSLVGSLWQDLQTIPGRDYVISYALDHTSQKPSVTWGGAAVGPFTNFVGDALWRYYYCYVHADSEVTRLNFNAPGLIDDVKVGWLQEPIQITSQPESRAVFEGNSVAFVVGAVGAPPLTYQWNFQGAPISGATNRSLLLSQVRSSQAGLYSVSISNAGGSNVSDSAQLQISNPSTRPEIVVQPVGDICPQGYGCSLVVFAVGAAPLSYQWSTGGTNIPNATNAVLTFESMQPGNAGTYNATVSNSLGSVVSLPALISVTNTTGGGRLFFDTATNNTPIFDVDGVTRLEGSNFVA
ncbi:MAG TPA: immunoglobulin domain-containing protein [Candidatus Saccharimonadales bacterium]|nr:immunoglobulin domain-containing protein [Candidatus Saccharimonadales bacterium]